MNDIIHDGVLHSDWQGLRPVKQDYIDKFESLCLDFTTRYPGATMKPLVDFLAKQLIHDDFDEWPQEMRTNALIDQGYLHPTEAVRAPYESLALVIARMLTTLETGGEDVKKMIVLIEKEIKNYA